MKLARQCSALAAAILVSAAAAAGVAAAASGSALPLLDRLDSGLWELRNLDGRGRFEAICLGDPGALVQLQHRRASCTRSVVAQTRDQLEVRYSCPAGFGQTTIRIEGKRLARIESQGVDNGVPFGFRAEARRIRACR
ncbi:MAG TPA: hypothetical protein VF702_14795 [Allosphingosinicella sp.]|jgi:hypothetical protein